MQKRYKKSSKKGSDETQQQLVNEAVASTSQHHMTNQQTVLSSRSASFSSSSSSSPEIFHVEATVSHKTQPDLKLKASNTNADMNHKLAQQQQQQQQQINTKPSYSKQNAHNIGTYIKANDKDVLFMNAQLNEYKDKEKALLVDKEQLEQALDHYKRVNQELIHKFDVITKSAHLNEQEAQSDRHNVDFYKQEIRKRDEHIK